MGKVIGTIVASFVAATAAFFFARWRYSKESCNVRTKRN